MRKKKKNAYALLYLPLSANGAQDRTRTGTEFPPKDFKSFASAIPPLGQLSLEAPPGIGPGIKALQASALPLGYGALCGAEDEIRTRDICLGKATLYH